jgi:hypothetical protein
VSQAWKINTKFCNLCRDNLNFQAMNIKTIAIILGIIFIAVGLLGFVPNPVIGDSENAIFHADTLHSWVHIVSGILFLLFAFAISRNVSLFLKVFGIIYFLLGVLGLINIGSSGMGKVLGFLHVNGADNFLHIGLGVVIFLAGTVPHKSTVAH